MKSSISLIFLLTFFSCKTATFLDTETIPNKVKIPRKARLVKARPYNENRSNSLRRGFIYEIFETKTKTDASVEIKEDKIKIEIFESEKLVLRKKVNSSPNISIENFSKFRIPNKLTYSKDLKNQIGNDSLLYRLKDYKKQFFISEAFRYFSSGKTTQALTIPFKFRAKVGSNPYEVTTGVNAGIGFGWKGTWYSLRPIYSKDNTNRMVGYSSNQFSLSLLPFVGLTTIKHTQGNTDPKIQNDRTIIGINYGISGISQLNRLSFGAALGWDSGFGEGRKDWIYQDKYWIGIIVGLDILK